MKTAGTTLRELIARTQEVETRRPLSPAAQIWARDVAALWLDHDARQVLERRSDVDLEAEGVAERLEILHQRDRIRRRRRNA